MKFSYNVTGGNILLPFTGGSSIDLCASNQYFKQ